MTIALLHERLYLASRHRHKSPWQLDERRRHQTEHHRRPFFLAWPFLPLRVEVAHERRPMETWRETVDVVEEEVDDVVQEPSWEDRLEGVRRVVWERGVRWRGERGGR